MGCLGKMRVDFFLSFFFFTRFFNAILESERMTEKQRSALVLIFKNKGEVQNCSNHRLLQLMKCTIKLRERVAEARLRGEVGT